MSERDDFIGSLSAYLFIRCSSLPPLTLTGKNLEYGLRQEGVLSFVRELNGNEEEAYESYLKDASLYARGTNYARDIMNSQLAMISRCTVVGLVRGYQYINPPLLPSPILILLRSVVILSVRGVLVRKFMLAAHALGMTKGEWVFLDVEIFQV